MFGVVHIEGVVSGLWLRTDIFILCRVVYGCELFAFAFFSIIANALLLSTITISTWLYDYIIWPRLRILYLLVSEIR